MADLFLNRELSWLEFNGRVLEEATSPSVPLLERLKFLAISCSNLNEFYMVRVGGLHLLNQAGSSRRDPSGRTPAQQLAAIETRVKTMVGTQYETFAQLEANLADHGIHRITPSAVTPEQARHLERLFDDKLSAVLTPIGIDNAKPFPLFKNLGLHLAVRLAKPSRTPRERFAIIPLAGVLNRFITLPAKRGYHYILLEDAIALFVHRFFPEEKVLECCTFRLARNADLQVQEDKAVDLLAQMEQILDARKLSACVRLEISASSTQKTRRFLQRQRALSVADDFTFLLPGPVALDHFMSLATIEGHERLKYPEWPRHPSPSVKSDRSMFEILSKGDVLLSHPYQSFSPVVRLIEEAADDPDVLAIKQTLYRTSKNSPIVAALRRAATSGKHVTVIVELKARFDEAQNIAWAKQMELDGVHVIYGIKGLKTHAKLCIIVRREAQGIVRYLHFGTGNYNEKTARLYSDVSFMTRSDYLGSDASAFFNTIAGYSTAPRFLKLAMAPLGLRETLLNLIESETERQRQGEDGLIMAKLNSLVDPTLIEALYRASAAGVKVQLNIRGICCLRPGVKGLSEHITVISIIDRFLEHARIFYFHQGGQEKVFISSADWMPRNLDRRIELLVPVEDVQNRQTLTTMLETYFADNQNSWRLLPDGRYRRLQPDAGVHTQIRSQLQLYSMAGEAMARIRQKRRTTFEPHLPPTD